MAPSPDSTNMKAPGTTLRAVPWGAGMQRQGGLRLALDDNDVSRGAADDGSVAIQLDAVPHKKPQVRAPSVPEWISGEQPVGADEARDCAAGELECRRAADRAGNAVAEADDVTHLGVHPVRVARLIRVA